MGLEGAPVSVIRQGIVASRNGIQFQILAVDGDEVLEEIDDIRKIVPALVGDRVIWSEKAGRWNVAIRANHPPLVGTLELASKTTYGMTSRGNPLYLFVPFRKDYPNFIVGCGERDRTLHRIGVIRFEGWEGTTFPRGTLIRILGACGDWKAEREALQIHACPWSFPKDLVIPKKPEEVIEERIPLPPISFHIDPAGCKDVDDVLSIETVGEEEFRFWVTIADVDAWVPAGSQLDLCAAMRSQTYYQDGKAVRPMLPPELSEDACSLAPDSKKARGGVSLCLVWKDGKVAYHFWALTKVNTQFTFTYDDFLDKCTNHGISWTFVKMVASILLGREALDAHEIVEAFMLTYNQKAAEIVRKVGAGILRKHGAGNQKLRERLQVWGANPEFLTLAEQGAVYCGAKDPEPRHTGLGCELYCHATSPIRRYADLVNQRILKAAIRESLEMPGSTPFSEIRWMNDRQKILKSVARDEFFLEILEKKGGKGEISAIILEKIVKNSQKNANSQNSADSENCENCEIPDSEKMKKYKLWIPEWKRILSWKSTAEGRLGQDIRLQFLAVPSGRRWKERILFRLLED